MPSKKKVTELAAPLRRNVTLQDVANLAGVNKASVSVVLNGSRSNTGVSQIKRERIRQAARELDYTPNALAQSLSRGRTDIISFYSGQGFLDLNDQLIVALVAGLNLGCGNHQKDLLLCGTFRGSESEEIYRKLADGKTDGLIFHTPIDNPLIEMLAKSHLPVVAVADSVPQLPSVTVDIGHGAQLLAKHLYDLGHRNVLYRATTYHLHPLSSVVRREVAFLEAALQHGIAVQRIPVDEMALYFTDTEKALLRSSSSPTAAVCWCDNSARATLSHCTSAGMKVPDDLAVAGSDGLRAESADTRRITTIRAPWSAVAMEAIRVLVQLMNGESVPVETVLPVTLVIGNTTTG